MDQLSVTDPNKQIRKVEYIFSQLQNRHKTTNRKISDLKKNFNSKENEWNKNPHSRSCQNVDKKTQLLIDEWPTNCMMSSFKKTIRRLEYKCRILEEKTNRKTCKIMIFGKASGGKKTVLNAILGQELFLNKPNTTFESFIYITKSTDSLNSIKYRRKMATFAEISNIKDQMEKPMMSDDTFNPDIMNTNETTELVLNIENNRILRTDTLLIDASENETKTEIIETHSLGSDIFMYIFDSIITEQNKTLLALHSTHIIKPDIYILVNGWDNYESDNDKILKKKREFIAKLSEYVSVARSDLTELDIEASIYFISSEELSFLVSPNYLKDKRNEKRKKRLEDYERFEDSLSCYIDNIQRNKSRRFKQEIDRLSNNINEEYLQFSQDLLKLKDDNLVIKHEVFIKKSARLRMFISEKCEKEFIYLRKKLIGDIEDLIIGPTIEKSEWINFMIFKCQKELDNDLEFFVTCLCKKISRFLKESQEASKKLRNLFKLDKPILKKISDTRLTMTPGDLICANIAHALGFVPIINVVCVPIFSLVAHYNNQQLCLENKMKLNHSRDYILILIENNFKSIKDHFKKLVRQIEYIYTNKKQLTEEYWRNVTSTLIPLDDVREDSIDQSKRDHKYSLGSSITTLGGTFDNSSQGDAEPKYSFQPSIVTLNNVPEETSSQINTDPSVGETLVVKNNQ